eukprot:3092838-Karenia_brevis.AAC.1
MHRVIDDHVFSSSRTTTVDWPRFAEFLLRCPAYGPKPRSASRPGPRVKGDTESSASPLSRTSGSAEEMTGGFAQPAS